MFQNIPEEGPLPLPEAGRWKSGCPGSGEERKDGRCLRPSARTAQSARHYQMLMEGPACMQLHRQPPHCRVHLQRGPSCLRCFRVDTLEREMRVGLGSSRGNQRRKAKQRGRWDHRSACRLQPSAGAGCMVLCVMG